MRLEAGARIGPYEVLSLIGSGGMGEVYKALDTRLGRTVAIKILHTPSPDLRQRFEREARVVAALQHPHICTLIDIGHHAGADYIVMEFLDGKPLGRPQPLGKVVEYGVQIADAVDAVHRRGVIHRDLKPENILVTAHGVKILDFGIAKTLNPQETATQPGLAIGTPAFMPPEQWRGAADHRTDIYALGCVLYVMAAGELPSQKPLQPARLEWIVRGCLAPEPDDRWQSARDVGRLLKTVTEPEAATTSRRRGWLWPAGGLLLGLAGLLTGWFLRPDASRELLELSIAPPLNASFLVGRNMEGGFAVSPDGRMLAFSALADSRAQLWIRRLDSADAQAIAGTEGAYFPFWSPDSKWVAFYTPDRLMKVAVAGGAPQTLWKTDPRLAGGAWGAGDVLVITGVPGGNLHRMALSGGVPASLFPGGWPHFLPDGRRFLFQRDNATWIGSIDGSEPRELLGAPAMKPSYSRRHLLFVRNRMLMAQPFDPATARLSGTPFTVSGPLAGLDEVNNPGEYSAGSDGVLVHADGGTPKKLTWRDRGGKLITELTAGVDVATPRISPDGQRVAFARADRENTDIWVTDLAQKFTKLTFDPVMDRFPVWSPDGKTITFASGEGRQLQFFRKASDGTGSVQQLTTEPFSQHPMDWSPDGKTLLFTRNAPNTDLMILPAGGQPYVFLRTHISEAHSQFNPAAPRWIAYSADDSGRREIYVREFTAGKPAGDALWPISHATGAGGTMPRWRRDGRELYYWALDGNIMAVGVNPSGSTIQSSTPKPLFTVQPPTLRTNDISFDVSPDGQRFAIIEPVERLQLQPLTVVTDWLAAVKQRSK